MVSQLVAVRAEESLEMAFAGDGEIILFVLEGQWVLRIEEGSGEMRPGSVIHAAAGLAPTVDAETNLQGLVFIVN